MKSKAISCLLALALIFAVAFSFASAATAAPVSVSTYAELVDAVSNMAEEIVITADITLETNIGLFAPATIRGEGENITITGDGNFALFSANGQNAVFENLTFVAGATAVNTTGAGTLTFTDCTIKECTASAIYYEAGPLTLTNCLFENNYTAGVGSCLLIGDVPGNILNATDCSFINNGTPSQGGAIYAPGNTVMNFTNCTFKDNYTQDCGGAIFSGWGTVNTTNCTFDSNRVEVYNGGCIYLYSAVLNSVDCVYTNNTCLGAEYGAAAVVQGDEKSVIYIKGGEISNNQGGVCGAICAGDKNDTLSVEGVTFKGNTAMHGPAIYTGGKAVVTVKDCVFEGNSATASGGAVQVGNYIEISGCTFTDNAAAEKGGAVVAGVGGITVTGCTFSGNTAAEGNAIYSYGLITADDMSAFAEGDVIEYVADEPDEPTDDPASDAPAGDTADEEPAEENYTLIIIVAAASVVLIAVVVVVLKKKKD